MKPLTRIFEPQGKNFGMFSMPQNDNNSKTVSQLTVTARHQTNQNDPGATSTLAPTGFQSEIV